MDLPLRIQRVGSHLRLALWRWHGGAGTRAVSYTYTAGGTYNVTLTVTDNKGFRHSKHKRYGAAGSMHVGDLDGRSTYQQNTWIATVTVTVEDSRHNPLTNATVNGNWTNGGTSSCTTNCERPMFRIEFRIPKNA